MEQLFTISNRLISRVNSDYTRYLYNRIDWDNRLIAIVGPRGVGKDNHAASIHQAAL